MILRPHKIMNRELQAYFPTVLSRLICTFATETCIPGSYEKLLHLTKLDLVLAVSSSCQVHLWDMTTGNLSRTLWEEPDTVLINAVLSHDQTFLIILTNSQTGKGCCIIQLDIATGQVLGKISNNLNQTTPCIFLSPASDYLWTTTSNQCWSQFLICQGILLSDPCFAFPMPPLALLPSVVWRSDRFFHTLMNGKCGMMLIPSFVFTVDFETHRMFGSSATCFGMTRREKSNETLLLTQNSIWFITTDNRYMMQPFYRLNARNCCLITLSADEEFCYGILCQRNFEDAEGTLVKWPVCMDSRITVEPEVIHKWTMSRETYPLSSFTLCHDQQICCVASRSMILRIDLGTQFRDAIVA